MILLHRLDFVKGFKIGYRRLVVFPPAELVVRALISVAAMLNLNNLVGCLCGGDVSFSSILPAAVCEEGRLKLLLPFIPPLSALWEPGGKRRVDYVTLPAIVRIVEAINECAQQALKGDQFIRRIRGSAPEIVHIECAAYGESRKDEMVKRVLGLFGECKPTLCTTLEEAVEHRNVLDRLTGSAKPFVFQHIRVQGPMLLLSRVPERCLEEYKRALTILGELGLGGGRSRGFGRFHVSEVSLCKDDLNVIRNLTSYADATPGRYVFTLGGLPVADGVADWSRSFFLIESISGPMGPPHAQFFLRRPLVIAGFGSLVRVPESGVPGERLIVRLKEAFPIPSVFVFNPLVVF